MFDARALDVFTGRDADVGVEYASQVAGGYPHPAGQGGYRKVSGEMCADPPAQLHDI